MPRLIDPNRRLNTEPIISDLKEVIECDCPECKRGKIKLERVYDKSLGAEWRGVRCDNSLCFASFTMRADPPILGARK